MSDEEVRQTATCANPECAHVFDDFEAALATDDQHQHVLPCPTCGGLGRNVDIQAFDRVEVHEQIKMKAKAEGEKKPYLDVTSGDSLFRKTGEWHDAHQVIDRENDWYDKVVTDPDGNVIRDVHEPLTEHRDRGSAKPRNPDQA